MVTMMVVVTVVVMLVTDVVVGLPDVIPGHCICPANAETEISKVRIATAMFRRKVFTEVAS